MLKSIWLPGPKERAPFETYFNKLTILLLLLLLLFSSSLFLLFSLLLFLVLFSALIQAEQVAAKMIEKGQMKASIDQLEGILEFENNTNTFAVWDSQVAGVCQQVFFWKKSHSANR